MASRFECDQFQISAGSAPCGIFACADIVHIQPYIRHAPGCSDGHPAHLPDSFFEDVRATSHLPVAPFLITVPDARHPTYPCPCFFRLPGTTQPTYPIVVSSLIARTAETYSSMFTLEQLSAYPYHLRRARSSNRMRETTSSVFLSQRYINAIPQKRLCDESLRDNNFANKSIVCHNFSQSGVL